MRINPTLFTTCLLAGCLGDSQLHNSDSGFVAVDMAQASCTADNDGVIARSELPLVVGASATYLQNPAGTVADVNPDGEPSPEGPAWDLTSTAGEAVSLPIVSVTGQWFADRFPDATYATFTDLATRIYGVFKLTDSALQLLGYASEEPDRTILVYQTPLDTIRFPLREGDSWLQTGHIVNGKFNGLPVAETDTYKVTVDARGVVVLPFLRVSNTLRVHVELDQALPGGTTTHTIQYLFFRECTGELGRMVSQSGETDPSFRGAATFRRLAL